MINGYLSIGSNLGSRNINIKKAIFELSKIDSFNILSVSSIYETKPMYYLKQNNFLNIAILYLTNLDPFILLDQIQNIEKILGRPVKRLKYSERIIDIDIITYGNEIIHNNRLHIPHKLLEERLFVLIPINEIDKNFILPLSRIKISTLIKKIDNKNDVKLYKVINLSYAQAISYSN